MLIDDDKQTNNPVPTEDAPAPAGQTAGVTPPASEDPEDKVTLTQSELNARFGKTREEGRLSLAKAYGYEDLETFDKDMKALKEKKDSEMSEAERLREENKTRKQRETQLAKENRDLKINGTAREIAHELDVDPKKLSDVLKLRDAEGTEMDAEGNVDRKAIKASIQAVLTRNPYFKRGTGSVGGGGTPATAASNAMTLDQQIAVANKEGRYMDAIQLQTRKLFQPKG